MLGIITEVLTSISWCRRIAGSAGLHRATLSVSCGGGWLDIGVNWQPVASQKKNTKRGGPVCRYKMSRPVTTHPRPRTRAGWSVISLRWSATSAGTRPFVIPVTSITNKMKSSAYMWRWKSFCLLSVINVSIDWKIKNTIKCPIVIENENSNPPVDYDGFFTTLSSRVTCKHLPPCAAPTCICLFRRLQMASIDLKSTI